MLLYQHRRPNISLPTIRSSTRSSISWGICCFWVFSVEINSAWNWIDNLFNKLKNDHFIRFTFIPRISKYLLPHLLTCMLFFKERTIIIKLNHSISFLATLQLYIISLSKKAMIISVIVDKKEENVLFARIPAISCEFSCWHKNWVVGCAFTENLLLHCQN